jgi:hypothetical protein
MAAPAPPMEAPYVAPSVSTKRHVAKKHRHARKVVAKKHTKKKRKATSTMSAPAPMTAPAPTAPPQSTEGRLPVGGPKAGGGR